MSETSTDQTPVAASEEFIRGVKAAAEPMRLYFLDENEGPIYDVSSKELQYHADGAVADALSDERLRLEHAQASGDHTAALHSAIQLERTIDQPQLDRPDCAPTLIQRIIPEIIPIKR
ncbi:hypothetical protein [Psychromicrobium sp. YIM B11713]|uniref:hypothetical protein n=1 Tax=Psychromicrobium sp. YIM B11713 TaxID=3145233 RepID=UPI00374ECA30